MTVARTGLILAAGQGSRQGCTQAGLPKPLLPVRGRALILRALDTLVRTGCDQAVVVVRDGEHRIRRFVEEIYDGPLDIRFVGNPHIELQNGVSVLSARRFLPEEFVLTMADHVFERAVPQLLANHLLSLGEACLVVDSKVEKILDIEDATKVSVTSGRITDIGKTLSQFNAVDCGLFIAGTSLFEALERIYQRAGDVSLSDGARVLAKDGRMEALDLGAGRWLDVDTPEMLMAAEHLPL